MSNRFRFVRGVPVVDPRGQHYTLRFYEELEEVTTIMDDDPISTVVALHLETDTGHEVMRIAKGKYLIPETGVILTSDDPEAP